MIFVLQLKASVVPSIIMYYILYPMVGLSHLLMNSVGNLAEGNEGKAYDLFCCIWIFISNKAAETAYTV